MSPTRVFGVALATVFVAIGCADESTTGIPGPEIEAPVDLTFTLPEITPEILAHAVVEEVEPTSGPSRAFGDALDPEPEDDPPTDVMSRIWGASTVVGVTSGYAYSTGRHSYSGNTGKVSTEAIVTMNGQEIGRQPASRQNYGPFLGDFGEIHQIWAEAYIFTDLECGLRVDGRSEHAAWWQWFLGTGVPHWGESNMSTQAFPPYEQPECEPDPNSGYTGGEKGAGTDGNDGSVCWYWVTYDPYTGVVLDSEFLNCEAVEGG
ncbi:MAG: hypothetical protein PVJ80_14570 [Gemmatimonadota bacterium]